MIPLASVPQPRTGPATRVRTYTFGCKVNLADTVTMETVLAGRSGCEVNRKKVDPDVVIVNTCTVTASADRQARQFLRRIHREHPDARIIVTGCYAEKEPVHLGSFAGVSDVVPIQEQSRIPEVLGFDPLAEGESAPIGIFSERTRAFLKMQDGCNAYCSFCILPYVRGRSRSIPLATLVNQARSYYEHGYREVVVTGTHIGAYGRDLEPRMRLAAALDEISRAVPELKLRVSSLEPQTLSADIIRLARSNENIRPHFHIPLQSGSDSVLRRMNRKYRMKNYVERVSALAKTREAIGIGADVIVGFPGESEEEFQQTVEQIETLPITYLHVFPYSPRPGTRASGLPDDVTPQAKKSRVRHLRAISRKKRREFHSRFLGTVQSVLVEGKRDRAGRLGGYTPHYVAVRFLGPDRLMQKEVDVQLLTLEEETIVGRIV